MAEVELPSRKESGLLSGGAGILLVAWLLTGRSELADDLYERVRENEDSENNQRAHAIHEDLVEGGSSDPPSR